MPGISPVGTEVVGGELNTYEQVYRPGSDVSATGWTFTGGSSFAQVTNEIGYSPLSYATSAGLANTATVAIEPSMPAGSYTVRVAGKRSHAVGQIRLVFLDAGSVSVGATAWQALAETEALYSLSVTTTATATQVRTELQS